MILDICEFTRSFLEVNWISLGLCPSKYRFPFPILDENSIKDRRVSNPLRPLEWLVAKEGGLLFFMENKLL